MKRDTKREKRKRKIERKRLTNTEFVIRRLYTSFDVKKQTHTHLDTIRKQVGIYMDI